MLPSLVSHQSLFLAKDRRGTFLDNHKYLEILEEINGQIHSGKYAPGSRLPSEAALVKRFGVSRMTVFRAMRELQSQGIVTRRAGSGTFVAPRADSKGLLFGLLIPDFGRTEIFESICQGMMEAPQARHHSLLWGNAVTQDKEKEHVAEQLCQHYISQKVAGVFFAPLEFSAHRHQANHHIVNALSRSGIPIVLLDRCLAPYPNRSTYDLVGVDNRRTAYVATEHLIRAGAKKVGFFCEPNSASTVDARIAGYREALVGHQMQRGQDLVKFGDPADTAFVKSILKKDNPDAFLCANDHTAGLMMHTLLSLGVNIPVEVRLVGIDDLKYARLLPVPLTTQRQPCRDIGKIALAVMLDRIADPGLPTRDVLLGCELIVRKSCGFKKHDSASTADTEVFAAVR
jgi:GntR family transcriptional regulator of arabinose operon